MRMILAASAVVMASVPMASNAALLGVDQDPPGDPFTEPAPPDPWWYFSKPVRVATYHYNQYGSLEGYDVLYCDGTSDSVRDGPTGQIVYSQTEHYMCLEN